ncbi:MAG: NADH-quinone oxidoreductase subunit NuoN [Burkholderiaceae bacterium]|jgi:NADH-quinone oxidoreductase subunit N|nr:NADH-quinone oxidoreductase subunit NuoN [Burkholderiaceae bacterium]MBU6292120.1 NADH-quinone oxidoreductase subunit NuoN [Burkholderiales bacterium]
MTELNVELAGAEIFLAVATMVVMVAGLFADEEKTPLSHRLSLLVIAVTAVLAISDFAVPGSVYAFDRSYVLDPMASLLKCCAAIATFLTLVYARTYSNQRGMLGGNLSGEFYVLALLTLLGQMIMISGNSFLVIYLGLELMSLSLYALVALRRDHAISTEASMKYFVLGALASGFMLYGMSMIYGATGSLMMSQIAQVIASGSANKTVLALGLVFLVSGLAFKLSAAPFHMWAPDVYHGAPTSVTLLIGGAPKLAAFAIIIRILVEGLGAMAAEWQQMMIVLAVVSLIVGNITAIAQTNIKRMLAYSTISQMGFLLLGLLSGVFEGSDAASAANAYSSAMFYVITYVLTTVGSFAVILFLSRSGFEADHLDDFKGLSQRSPWFAAIMMVLLLSLAGVPPMVGFYAKLAVLQAALAAGHLGLVVFAVLASLVSAYYYLRVVKLMYFDEPADTEAIEATGGLRLVLSLNGVAVVLLGVLPGPLMAACVYAMTQALAS